MFESDQTLPDVSGAAEAASVDVPDAVRVYSGEVAEGESAPGVTVYAHPTTVPVDVVVADATPDPLSLAHDWGLQKVPRIVINADGERVNEGFQWVNQNGDVVAPPKQ